MNLPQGLNLRDMATRWASILQPWLNNPASSGAYIFNQSLILGVTVVNHKLGRKPQGWTVIDINGAATVYRSQPFNDLTLTLTASAGVTVSLYVF